MKLQDNNHLPHIVLIIARGETVRNFLYSETLEALCEHARVTLLTALTDKEFQYRFRLLVDDIIELKEYPEKKMIGALRELIVYSHYRWIWTEKVRNKWQILDSQAATPWQKIHHAIWKALIFLLANRLALNMLAWLENRLTILLNPSHDFEELFTRLKPDLVFNTSHIHALRGELPVHVAHKMGIRTATFIFSWDNLSSRGRILPHYDDYLVWHESMRDEFLHLYPSILPKHVFITGTPQFDFHFRPEYCFSRHELCELIGLDPSRPFILYTTGMDRDFPEEVKHVQTVINILGEYSKNDRPQLVVRMYVKGISMEMKRLAMQNILDVFFPPILWEENWFTPQEQDITIYTSLLHHCAFGINPASTVSLELIMLDKPVINIGFDPPGSDLPEGFHWKRHIEFDHYHRVVQSGAVRVAWSVDDIRCYIHECLTSPDMLKDQRKAFIQSTFGNTLDGKSAYRVSDALIKIVSTTPE